MFFDSVQACELTCCSIATNDPERAKVRVSPEMASTRAAVRVLILYRSLIRPLLFIFCHSAFTRSTARSLWVHQLALSVS